MTPDKVDQFEAERIGKIVFWTLTAIPVLCLVGMVLAWWYCQ